jgi:hypothetical protein
MANSYATERWLRARLKEHDVALRTAAAWLRTIADDEPWTLADIQRALREADDALENASARSNRV